ncbi:uncharacterized protein LOC110727362 [Chenopodium quinoa]|uniref:uncharacterized protein LOC110727362 n=1 Tax=Chenopodium quinoa TaxID=63459 RepID=UPI000B775740|nr:uncharacterized protein LOC110727362 [Chenopodium quinoa]XP_021762618.1 uncharacterized protein LOC110727362 [Chenopodium quinoa]
MMYWQCFKLGERWSLHSQPGRQECGSADALREMLNDPNSYLDHGMGNIIRDVAHLLQRNLSVTILHAGRAVNHLAHQLAALGRCQPQILKLLDQGFFAAVPRQTFASTVTFTRHFVSSFIFSYFLLSLSFCILFYSRSGLTTLSSFALKKRVCGDESMD